ncbi:hypothetical protein [Bdellovibrio reynosensis]|uniref:ATP synthase subunit I n=1 Tax=Bdellovibrio reynosensis TaxID=2835041 RepID=A0ABY4C659_9BACT|nr:hypothetical protein [Bdellovibrio reynosensis]UOF00390.1 hypothetical protein MNR06_11845 [Bdellovibrio reynosensis]
MKIVLIVQSVVTLIGGLLLQYFYAPQQALSFVAGSLTILTSCILLAVGFSLIFRKKLIALAIGIIVFKYAILGIIIFTLVKLSWFSPLWFSMGVASLILSAISFAVKEASREGKDNVV